MSLLTPAQVAEVLSVDVGKVTGLCKSGELRASNVARVVGKKARWRIRQADLDAFLDRRANTPPPKPAHRRRKPATGVIEFY
jgi:excisionase family DNA binding protein